MNRAERSRGKWHKLNPRLPWAEFTQEVSDDSQRVMMAILRELVGPDAPFTDADLWETVRDFIKHGLLNVYFRFDRDGGIEIEPEFLMPHDTDDEPEFGGFAA